MAFLLTIKNDILHIVPKEVPLLCETLLCPSYGNLLAVKVPSEYSEIFLVLVSLQKKSPGGVLWGAYSEKTPYCHRKTPARKSLF